MCITDWRIFTVFWHMANAMMPYGIRHRKARSGVLTPFLHYSTPNAELERGAQVVPF